ncbi:hypothetical protein [Epinotia aporema granulovirus]|uniref:Uncharacterized protein n=1 Tax=Epinotia aporema granulovirus TaxID=166056 RepID=K4EQE1_9BBAC|nr:hypothetical protein [Epinotia aporema granulovirus]AER41468.1 hypothetical protein [Epinotia aporema granulovirus]
MLREETSYETKIKVIFDHKEQFEHLAKQLNSTEIQQILPTVDVIRYKLSKCADTSDFNSLQSLLLLLKDVNKRMRRMKKWRSVKTELWLMCNGQ